MPRPFLFALLIVTVKNGVNMYRVAICEDEQALSNALAKTCRDIMDGLDIEHGVIPFKSSEDFLAFSSERKIKFDLILLDIVMGSMDGMELAKVIRKTDSEAAIIFTTSSADRVFDGYDVGALHYLTKPVDEAKLKSLIQSAYSDKFQNSIFVFKSGDSNYRVMVKDIISLETVGRKVEIAYRDRMLHCPGKLSELLERLPNDRFVRCHQGFAVNIGNIREITRFWAIAVNGKKIPISRAYMKDVQKAFLSNMQSPL
jgi:DNA-binding LytR/AlgR family response regulator